MATAILTVVIGLIASVIVGLVVAKIYISNAKRILDKIADGKVFCFITLRDETIIRGWITRNDYYNISNNRVSGDYFIRAESLEKEDVIRMEDIERAAKLEQFKDIQKFADKR